MPSLRRIAILLLTLSLVLAASSVWAAGPAARSERLAKIAQPDPAKLLRHAWSFLTALWSGEGCHIDPNGRCVTSPVPAATVPAQTDTGCAVDPDGRCRS